jgi:RNA polymerase sigma-70 factor, ECF subfamily
VQNVLARLKRSQRPSRASDRPPARPLPSDPEIVAGLTRGEPWAAEQLYDRVHPYVERTLRRVLRYSRSEYEDLMQASFERIVRVLSERSLGGACDLPTWSSAVAAHVALDALRRRVRERKLFRNEPVMESLRGPDPSAERHAEARFEVARVQQVFGRMKTKYAETVLLHDVLGHDLREIAQLTGVSVAAAQSRLVRGRKDLLRRARVEKRSS